MSKEFLDQFALDVAEYYSRENNWPRDWDLDQIEEYIDEHEARLQEAKEYGIQPLTGGEGGWRVVFEIDKNNAFGFSSDAVLKISKTDGTDQNAQEIGAYEKVRNTPAEKHVAEVLDWGSQNRWLVQEKAVNAKPGDSQTVRENLNEHGFTVTDLRSDNCGRIDGQPVLIDLALLREI